MPASNLSKLPDQNKFIKDFAENFRALNLEFRKKKKS